MGFPFQGVDHLFYSSSENNPFEIIYLFEFKNVVTTYF